MQRLTIYGTKTTLRPTSPDHPDGPAVLMAIEVQAEGIQDRG